MPKHSSKFAKFFKKNGKMLVLGLIFIIVGIVAFLAFQEDNALKSQNQEEAKVIVIRKW
ncbi:MAG: hypothetical protein ABH865_04405 [Candidatus Omnitrophota bacterium]|nr:tetratricopeptide repeat protein [Candidatus Omnitrophota bacterium]